MTKESDDFWHFETEGEQNMSNLLKLGSES